MRQFQKILLPLGFFTFVGCNTPQPKSVALNFEAISISAEKVKKPSIPDMNTTAPSEPIQPIEKILEPSKPSSIALVPQKIKIPKAKSINDNVPMVFDIPVSYNGKVQYWISYFQGNGRSWFVKWLERSSRYIPILQKTLKDHGLPQDLAYMAMIESGLSPHANSSANAVGPWQFIKPTGVRYGLKVNWWLDERRDFFKSSVAASKYLRDMHKMFNNWYLVAAGYNAGENKIKRIIGRYKTKNFWQLSRFPDLERETKDYVPKLMAALLIAKAPALYGFKGLEYHAPISFEYYKVPGGTNLVELAEAIGVTSQYLAELNPDLIRGYIPTHIPDHRIRIPQGSANLVAHYVNKNFISER